MERLNACFTKKFLAWGLYHAFQPGASNLYRLRTTRICRDTCDGWTAYTENPISANNFRQSKNFSCVAGILPVNLDLLRIEPRAFMQVRYRRVFQQDLAHYIFLLSFTKIVHHSCRLCEEPAPSILIIFRKDTCDDAFAANLVYPTATIGNIARSIVV